MSEILTEAEIAEIEAQAIARTEGWCTQPTDSWKAVALRIIADLRAEQAARVKAEAQRDRLLEGLSSMVSAFGAAGCPACSGDCSAANPPVAGCPLRVLLEARAALAEIAPPTGGDQ